MTVKFEWGDNKRRVNLRKHGIDFVGCEVVFDGNILTVGDSRFSYPEHRLITFGLLDGRVVAVAHTETARKIRIISVRKATRSEQKSYFESSPV